MSDVGTNQPVLDQHDKRMIKETLTGTYSTKGSTSGKKGFPDHEKDAGGFEDYSEVHRDDSWDRDDDGLPDWWENIHGLNPNPANSDFTDANADEDRDGFTNLNYYLAWMAKPHFSSPSGTKIEIDLENLVRGYTDEPSFTISDVLNGKVTVTDGEAEFKPMDKGLGSFHVTVTDKHGDSMTRKVNIVSGYEVKF